MENCLTIKSPVKTLAGFTVKWMSSGLSGVGVKEKSPFRRWLLSALPYTATILGVYIGQGRFIHTRKGVGVNIDRIDSPAW